ncbi:hypothetical protein M407DRAFT_92034 [Tulasnella calospora MUT 4182]|uniref:Uncharacterized protein n=1 Tax=Tulasnella calospora MUT 4182 TaxID=1051891 RepID=A0A0C3QGH0_9AGAM|nr:hypothetical protein M407DRAFT_92034 [Tulasnella calospora MUT 4182]
MRVSVLIPYSTTAPVQSSSSSTATAHSRPQSPKTAFHSPHELVQQHGRRGSMGGIFSLQQYYRNSPSPPSTLGLVRRRTVFGENTNSQSGWGVRGVVCPEELVDAVDSSVDGELPLSGILLSLHRDTTTRSESHIGSRVVLCSPELLYAVVRGWLCFVLCALTIRRVN